MRTFVAIVLVLGVFVFVRDNSVHYIWKGFAAAWPILVLLGVAIFFVWQGMGLRYHKNFTYGPSKGTNWGRRIGDPLKDARDRAEDAGLDINISDVEDIYRKRR